MYPNINYRHRHLFLIRATSNAIGWVYLSVDIWRLVNGLLEYSTRSVVHVPIIFVKIKHKSMRIYTILPLYLLHKQRYFTNNIHSSYPPIQMCPEILYKNVYDFNVNVLN